MLPPRKKSWKSETLWDVTSSILGHNWRSFFSWTYLFYVFYRNSQKSSRCKMVCHPAGFRRLAAPNVDHVPLLSFLYVTGKAFTVMAILFTLDKILNDKVKGERRVNRSIPFKESSQPHSLRLWIYRICELSTILRVLNSSCLVLIVIGTDYRSRFLHQNNSLNWNSYVALTCHRSVSLFLFLFRPTV